MKIKVFNPETGQEEWAEEGAARGKGMAGDFSNDKRRIRENFRRSRLKYIVTTPKKEKAMNRMLKRGLLKQCPVCSKPMLKRSTYSSCYKCRLKDFTKPIK